MPLELLTPFPVPCIVKPSELKSIAIAALFAVSALLPSATNELSTGLNGSRVESNITQAPVVFVRLIMTNPGRKPVVIALPADPVPE